MLRVRLMGVIFAGIFRTSNLGDSISSNPERTALKRQGREGSDLYKSFAKKGGSLNIKRLLLFKENKIRTLRNLMLLYVWEDARVWVHWDHSFHMHFIICQMSSAGSRWLHWSPEAQGTWIEREEVCCTHNEARANLLKCEIEAFCPGLLSKIE